MQPPATPSAAPPLSPCLALSMWAEDLSARRGVKQICSFKMQQQQEAEEEEQQQRGEGEQRR